MKKNTPLTIEKFFRFVEKMPSDTEDLFSQPDFEKVINSLPQELLDRAFKQLELYGEEPECVSSPNHEEKQFSPPKPFISPNFCFSEFCLIIIKPLGSNLFVWQEHEY